MLTLATMLHDLGLSDTVSGADGVVVRRACVDSRQVEPGDLFVALPGERTDGHNYVRAAFDAGAVAALVERPVDGVTFLNPAHGEWLERVTGPVAVRVPDSLRALQTLARARRMAHPDLWVVGVTGSVGKTMTKDTIAAVLARHCATLRNIGNQNNEIGLPLTLMTLTDEPRCAVLEMGMYSLGEIALLCDIARPQIGVVTNVGPTHLERLGHIDNIARAKAELPQALPADGVAVLNGDDPRVRAMGRVTRAAVVTYGLQDCNDVQAQDIVDGGLDGIEFTVQIAAAEAAGLPAERQRLRIEMLGQHSILCALAAVAVGRIKGLTWDEIQRGLLSQGRGPRLQVRPGVGGVTLLDDCYNSSPASAIAALNTLSSLPGRHVAVLGDMLELGAYEAEGHREVGRHCATTADLLVAMGTRARLIAKGALEAGMPADAVYRADDTDGAIALLNDLAREGDMLLIKGSRSMSMEIIVRALEVGE
ncbi:MAG TPA: UDP-N-acetylmuramoyl-tripeptide--D-alanyl-D-alanine ligase [Chloroflexi bacterium]|nr:UDP-N-acetylmuramoyl-tripeptide--D-alanyl-D-alanine ligase [Chloroflexota bacterium]